MPLLAGPPTEGGLSQWGIFFGRFHPVFLHLPIGMLSLVLLLEFGRLFKKEKGSSTLVPMFFTAATAIVAVITGFLLFQSKVGEYAEELVDHHLWWGLGFACAMVLALVIKSWVDQAGGKGNFLYVLVLFASGGVMAVASHDGGSLTHGSTFLTAEAPNELKEIYNMMPGVEKLPIKLDGELTSVVPLEEQVVYSHYIQPIFDQKCVSCHGPDKQKGRMRMDTFEAVVAGGKEGDGLEPGNAKDSNLIYRIDLPEDDDEHMPREGKKQMEAHEMVVLEWWINGGASPDQKVVDAEIPADVQAAISKLVPPEEIAAQAKAAVEEAEAEEAARDAAELLVSELRKEFPSALNFESQDSHQLSFTAVSMRNQFDDAQLAKLEPVMDLIVSLDLASSKVSDEGVKLLAEAKSLRMLRLSESGVTDASLDLLAGLPELESLNLYGTAVSNEGVMSLAGLPNLKHLYLWQTQVDEAGADALRKAMPECEIVMGL